MTYVYLSRKNPNSHRAKVVACLVSRQQRNISTFDLGHSTLRILQVPTMADKVKEVAVGEADRIKSLTVQAARSAAYLYPIKVSIRTAVYCN